MAFINCYACNKRFSESASECPFCKAADMPTGAIRDHYNGPQFLPSDSAQKFAEFSGFFLHILPWAGFFLLMVLPAQYMNPVNWVIIILTGLVMALEAGQMGRGLGRAILWFLGAVVLWLVIYPVYMFRRARYGVQSNGILCLLGALFLTGISVKHVMTILAQRGGM